MRRFRDIVEDIKAPSTQSLWLNNGELKVYGIKGWASLNDTPEDRQELKEKVDTWLESLIEIINKPLCQCPHCQGTGYLDKIEKEGFSYATQD